MDLIELLNLREQTSVDVEERTRQAIADLDKRVQFVDAELALALDRLQQLEAVNGHNDEGVVLLTRSDQIREVSRLRSKSCKAHTALEEAALALDRLLHLRRVYQVAVEEAHGAA